MRNCEELLSKLNITIKNKELYELALTHPSYNVDANTVHQDYERLEYMGDAVLGYVSADLIYHLHPEMDQGKMSKLRSYLVKTASLSSYARSISLADYIKSGHSITSEQVNQSDKILEDVFEALIGAIYLDNGIEVAYEYVKGFLYEDVKNTNESVLTDAKTMLQEQMQAEHRDSVHYVTIDQKGPAHDRTFFVNVLFNDIVLATGSGKSKKAAEEDAARKALEKRSV